LYDRVRNSTEEVMDDIPFVNEIKDLIICEKRRLHIKGIRSMKKVEMSSNTHIELFGF